MMRIGIDVLERARADRLFRSTKSHKWVLHQSEVEHVQSMHPARAAEWCSGRLSAKEAVGKLLGRGFGQGLTWRDIEVVTGAYGEPGVVLHGGAQRRRDELDITDIQLSISHQPTVVVAVAVGVTDDSPAATTDRGAP